MFLVFCFVYLLSLLQFLTLFRSLDASHLLQQLPGSLELLKSYLKPALSGDEGASGLAVSTLQDMNICSLTLNEAHTIVKLKVNI